MRGTCYQLLHSRPARPAANSWVQIWIIAVSMHFRSVVKAAEYCANCDILSMFGCKAAEYCAYCDIQVGFQRHFAKDSVVKASVRSLLSFVLVQERHSASSRHMIICVSWLGPLIGRVAALSIRGWPRLEASSLRGVS